MIADRRYWDPQMETLPADRRRLLREHRLHWQVKRCWDGSPFYRAQLGRASLEPMTFGGTSRWAHMPILRTSNLLAEATAETWAVAPEAWWQRVDRPPDAPQRTVTDGDAIHQADLAARALWALGARPGQSIALASGPDRDAFVAGAERIGATLKAGGDPSAWVPLIERPFLLLLAVPCREGGVLHWNDDHFLIEVLDPATGQPAPSGATGALVVTDLAREGSPLLRFWTGLEASLVEDPCRCGRTSAWTPSLRPLG